MKNLRKALALVLALTFVLCFASCASFKKGFEEGYNSVMTTEATSEETNSVFVFTVVDLDGKSLSFEVPYTSGQTVGDALIAEELIAGEEGDYGLYVKTVNGITLDYDKDGAYWSFCIDGEAAMTGVDSETVKDGAEYSFVATKG